MKRALLSWLTFFLVSLPTLTLAQDTSGTSAPIAIVAAENFYGDVLKQLGGERVVVTSIISNPTQDPHLFEVSASTARQLSEARMVAYNGAAYDPWMNTLLAASPALTRTQIVAAELVGKREGDNPHLWYLPSTMPAFARAAHAFLIRVDLAHQQEYDAHLADFLASLAPIKAKIKALKAKYQGMPISATEPIFTYMTEAIGLQNRHARLQLAVMNGTEPSAADLAKFADDLAQRRVKLLIYNPQANSTAAQYMLELAKRAGIAVVSITETLPPGLSYQQWMLAQLNELEKALVSSSS